SAIAGSFVRRKLDDRILICPSDPLEAHVALANLGGTQYPYSYAMNAYMECRLPHVDGPATAYFGRATKLPRVRNSAEKVLLLEESEVSVNDGASAIVSFLARPGSAPVPGSTDWLAVRHDTGVIRPDSNARAGSPIPN